MNFELYKKPEAETHTGFLLRACGVVWQLYHGLYGALSALLYVLHCYLAYAFAMRATDRKAKPTL